jgi:hypothetical protein
VGIESRLEAPSVTTTPDAVLDQFPAAVSEPSRAFAGRGGDGQTRPAAKGALRQFLNDFQPTLQMPDDPPSEVDAEANNAAFMMSESDDEITDDEPVPDK